MGGIGQDFNNDFDIGVNRWPDTLPQCPLLSGFVEQRQLNVVSFRPDIGTTKVRKRTTASSVITTMSFKMNDAQIAIFNTFYKVTLKDGADGFQMLHPVTKLNYWWMFNKKETPRIDRISPRAFLVAFDLLKFLAVPPQRYSIAVRFAGSGHTTIDSTTIPRWDAAQLFGVGNARIDAAQQMPISARFDGIGNATIRDARQYQASVNLDGIGNLTATSSLQYQAAVRFDAASNLQAAQQRFEIAVRFDGTTGLTATNTQQGQTGVMFNAEGNLAFGPQQYLISVVFDGIGTLAERDAQRQQASARFRGLGSLSAKGSLRAKIGARFAATGNVVFGPQRRLIGLQFGGSSSMRANISQRNRTSVTLGGATSMSIGAIIV